MALVASPSSLKDRKCLNCERLFKRPKYNCDLGGNHKVEEKVYYAPHGSLTVAWKTDQAIPSVEGQGSIIRLPGKSAEFSRGIFRTSDPEEQDFFDVYAGCISQEQHEKLFVPEHIRNAAIKGERDDLKRKVDEQDAELERLRGELTAKAGV